MRKINLIAKYIFLLFIFIGAIFGIFISNLMNRFNEFNNLSIVQNEQYEQRKDRLMKELIGFSASHILNYESQLGKKFIYSNWASTNWYVSRNHQFDWVQDSEIPLIDWQTESIDINNPIHLLRSNEYANKIRKLVQLRNTLNTVITVTDNALPALNNKLIDDIYLLLTSEGHENSILANLLSNWRSMFFPNNIKTNWFPLMEQISKLPLAEIQSVRDLLSIYFFDESVDVENINAELFRQSKIYRWLIFAERYLNYDLSQTYLYARETGWSSDVSFQNFKDYLIRSHQDATFADAIIPQTPETNLQHLIKSLFWNLGKQFLPIVRELVVQENSQEQPVFALPTNWINWIQENTENLKAVLNLCKLLIFAQEESRFSENENIEVNNLQTYLQKLIYFAENFDFSSREMGYFVEGLVFFLKNDALNNLQATPIEQFIFNNLDSDTVTYLVQIFNHQLNQFREQNNRYLNNLSSMSAIFQNDLTGFKNFLFNDDGWEALIEHWTQLQNEFEQMKIFLQDETKNIWNINNDGTDYQAYINLVDNFLDKLIIILGWLPNEIIVPMLEDVNLPLVQFFQTIKSLTFLANPALTYSLTDSFDIVYFLIKKMNYSQFGNLAAYMSDLVQDFKNIFLTFLRFWTPSRFLTIEQIAVIFMQLLFADLENLEQINMEEIPQEPPVPAATSLFHKIYRRLVNFNQENFAPENDQVMAMDTFLKYLFKKEGGFVNLLTQQTNNKLEEIFFHYLDPSHWRYENLFIDSEILQPTLNHSTERKLLVSFKTKLYANGYNIFTYSFIWEINLDKSQVNLTSWKRWNLENT